MALHTIGILTENKSSAEDIKEQRRGHMKYGDVKPKTVTKMNQILYKSIVECTSICHCCGQRRFSIHPKER